MAKVLIIEDQKFLAGMLQVFLSDYEVLLAPDGNTGLALFGVEKPDVVITDIQLPDMSGFDVLRSIRAKGTTPVIVLTAGEDYAALAVESGAALSLRKPTSKASLLAAVNALLAGNSSTPR